MTIRWGALLLVWAAPSGLISIQDGSCSFVVTREHKKELHAMLMEVSGLPQNDKISAGRKLECVPPECLV